MSDTKKLKKVVDGLMRDNNVDLKDLIKPVVTRIAGEFRAAGLIPSDVEEQMLVMGVDNFTLATKLVNACQTSLVMYPDTNFPKFIEILEGHGGAMELLAKEMETKFEEARELCFNALVAAQITSLFNRATIYIYSLTVYIYIHVG